VHDTGDSRHDATARRKDAEEVTSVNSNLPVTTLMLPLAAPRQSHPAASIAMVPRRTVRKPIARLRSVGVRREIPSYADADRSLAHDASMKRGALPCPSGALRDRSVQIEAHDDFRPTVGPGTELEAGRRL
jgi:hypothetical protein